MSNVSAIIVVRNESHRLKELLPVLKPYFKIIVVDQQSTDDTVEVANQHADLVLSHPATGYASSSRGFALQHVDTDWVFVIDADEIPSLPFTNELPYWLDQDVDYYEVGVYHSVFSADNYNRLRRVLASIPTYSMQHRLFRKEVMKEFPRLHGGVRASGGKKGTIKYPVIYHFKTLEEWERDNTRYSAVKAGTYNPDIHF